MIEAFKLAGSPEIEVQVRRSARARRLTLRVSSLDGRVTLTVPTRLPEAEARRFVETRRDWISKARNRVPHSVEVGIGTPLPVAGGIVTLVAGQRLCQQGPRLVVPADRPGPAARGWLKALARERLAMASDRYAARLGVGYTRLSLRDARSRWGSCSSSGGLMYSWRLIMAPDPVLDYVAAHEVAHLRHMDHSPTFWALVAEVCPDWRRHRDWLRAEGPTLHRYRFGD